MRLLIVILYVSLNLSLRVIGDVTNVRSTKNEGRIKGICRQQHDPKKKNKFRPPEVIYLNKVVKIKGNMLNNPFHID